ncbi:transposase [Acetomicrobium mobile]|uniref:transposase n=1 Tax=Acetomicrobium mobile TaxID=97477 RepID=UPI00350E5A49
MAFPSEATQWKGYQQVKRCARSFRNWHTEKLNTNHFLSELIKKAAAIVLQEMLEAEVTDFLGRGHYERQTEGKESGYRNGYEPCKIKSAEGNICVYKPQVRGSEEPFNSKL